MLFTQPVLCF